jgi:hypothetical protein
MSGNLSRRAGVQLISTLLFLFVPAKTFYANIAKLGLISLVVVGFFLFTASYHFPGGAYQFPLYANALAHGTHLPAQVAQRDAGFPLLLLLSGYTLTGSFIPITLIHAIFAFLMPLLVYAAIHKLSPPVAFYAALCATLSLAPILFMKWIHHDQAYIFFSLLMLTCIAIFLQTRDYRFLYFFTFAAIAASLSRPAGNLLFPVFLVLAYVFGSRKIVHYLVCIGMVAVTVAAYQWHRYEIFNMRAGTSLPSYTGQQIFYNFYVNSREYGLRLGPEIGPNMARITDAVHRALQPNLRESPQFQSFKQLYRERPEFFEQQYLHFTPDQLTQRIYDLPNWEYYALMCDAEPNDQVFLMAAWEIFRAHPLYVIRFAQRNMRLMLFDPGYAHVRFHIGALDRVGLEFPPAMGAVIQPIRVHERAVHEMELDPSMTLPEAPQQAFALAEWIWGRSYSYLVTVTTGLMLVAWLALARALIGMLRPSWNDFPGSAALSSSGFVGPLIAASALLAYNVAVVSAFAEPDFRYHHFIVLLRILISGYGLFALAMILKDPGLKDLDPGLRGRVWIGSLAGVSYSGGLKQDALSRQMILLLAIAGYGLCVQIGPKQTMAMLPSQGWPTTIAKLQSFDAFESLSVRKANFVLSAGVLIVMGSWILFMIRHIS